MHTPICSSLHFHEDLLESEFSVWEDFPVSQLLWGMNLFDWNIYCITGIFYILSLIVHLEF